MRDADVVSALGRSGAVMLGKVGCYEAAFAGPDQDLPLPIPRNPWDPQRSTAGSSSGSAVAIAAGLVMAATGSDTGGSLRDPAAMCGVTGYKPRYGTMSTTGMFPFAPSLDTVGAMARTPGDVLLMSAGMQGVRPDPWPAVAPARGLRIGVVPRWSKDIGVSEGVNAIFENAVAALRSDGAEIVAVDLPPVDDFAATGWTIALAELRETHAEALTQGADGMGPMLRRGLAAADVVPAFRYIAALRHGRALARIVAQACEDVDVLLTPAQNGVAEPLEDRDGALPFEKASITVPFCVTGAAALGMPAGLCDELPVGVHSPR